MAKVKVKVSASTIYNLELEDYRDAYLQKCEEDGTEPAEGVPPEFAVASFKDDLNEGSEDLELVLENAPIEVELQS